MDELDAMKSVADALDGITEKDVKKRILIWAWTKYIGDDVPVGPSPVGVMSRKKQKQTSSRSTKKQVFGQIKSLNLAPSGKTSLADFVDAHPTSNNLQRVTVSVYYLTEEAGIADVSINHVYTCFKWMKWKLPSDFKNTIHQAGASGYLDTSDSENLVLTPAGENLIEHDLAVR